MKKKTKIQILIPSILTIAFIGILGGLWLHESIITSDNPEDFKYPTIDLFYSKYVDAAPLIESKEFRPEYCNGSVDKLIRLNPKTIKRNNERILQTALHNWLIENGQDKVNLTVYNNLKYEFTQLMDKEPIDNYALILTDNIKLHIRFYDDGRIFGGFYDNPWISNSCQE